MPNEIILDSYEEALLDYKGNPDALASKIGELAQEAEGLYRQSLRPENRKSWRPYCDVSCNRSILQAAEAENEHNSERRRSALEQALLFFRLAEMDDDGGIADAADGMENLTNAQSQQRYLN